MYITYVYFNILSVTVTHRLVSDHAISRTYIKKKPITYDAESIHEAREEVKNGSSVYAASKKHKIPYETLRRWCENPPNVQGSGKTTVITMDEERYIEEALVYSAKCGYPLDRKDVQCMVLSYI